MADELPGFIPQVLRLDDVSLLRADETVLNAMVDGWRAQMLARGLAVDTIRCSTTIFGDHPYGEATAAKRRHSPGTPLRATARGDGRRHARSYTGTGRAASFGEMSPPGC